MWAWLPDEMLQRIFEQLVAGRSPRALACFATLERRSSDVAKARLDLLKLLRLSPFSLATECILGTTATLSLVDRGIQKQHMEALGAALGCGALVHLTSLNLRQNAISDAGMSTLASACASGALASLKELNLGGNAIGDAGMTALASALGNGALPRCAFIDVGGNPASAEAKQAVKDAIASRK